MANIIVIGKKNCDIIQEFRMCDKGNLQTLREREGGVTGNS